MKIKKEIISSVLRDLGGTYRLGPEGLKRSRMTSGYFVALHGFEVPVNDFVRSAFSIPYEFEKALDTGFYLGFWVNSGQVYLDLVLWVSDRLEALSIGRAYDQQAIWNVENEKAIEIDYNL